MSKNKNKNQEKTTEEEEQASNKKIFAENLEKKMKMLKEAQLVRVNDSAEEIIFGRKGSMQRTPPARMELQEQLQGASAQDARKGSMETIWQDDDLLTSPTFKLTGEASVQHIGDSKIPTQDVMKDMMLDEKLRRKNPQQEQKS